MGESRRNRRQRGFTYIGVLILIVLLGIGLAFTGQVWYTSVMREKERDLLFVGGQFRRAIETFRAHNRNVGDGYPKSFDELLLDPHQPKAQRYLRKVYVDPMTGRAEWGLIKTPGGGIAGVYSLAKGTPVKLSGFPAQYESFVGAGDYSEWRFIADPGDGQGVVLAASSDQNIVPAAPSPPAQVVANAPMDVSDREPGKDPSCDWVAANDQRLCNQEKIKWRDAAVACFASGEVRASVCATGVRPADLPPLAIRFGSGR